MSGYFSGLSDADNPTGTTNNVASDYARLSEKNPAAFAGAGIFDKLFGGKGNSASKITSSPLPAPSGAGAQPSVAQIATTPQPSISSGKGLLASIFGRLHAPPQYNAAGEALVPGTPFTTKEFTNAIQNAAGSPPPMTIPPGTPQGFPGAQPGPQGLQSGPGNAPYQFPMGAPPASRAAPTPYGGQQFGGHTFGGAQFGGNRFGGNQFGGAQFGGNRFGGNQFGPQAQPQMQAPASPPVAGFFAGGHAFARGGYPEMIGYPAEIGHGMPMRHFARGGADYVTPDGAGDGRSDHIDAKLSPGEFVVDAETTSLLGNGDNEAGARKLEQMRQGIRRQKGKALAKGKFSPNAKTPDAYMRGGRD